MQYSSVYWEVQQSILPQKESVLGVFGLILRPLEHFGIRVRCILAMFSGIWVQILHPPAHLSNSTLYESQSSEICTSEHGIDQSLLGLILFVLAQQSKIGHLVLAFVGMVILAFVFRSGFPLLGSPKRGGL